MAEVERDPARVIELEEVSYQRASVNVNAMVAGLTEGRA